MPKAQDHSYSSDGFVPLRPRGLRRMLGPGCLSALGAPILDAIGPNVGCAAIAIGFLFCGLMFVWLYFNATTSRGNPVMGLVAGIVFTGLGLLGISVLLSGRRRPSNGKERVKDPKRLP